MQDLPDFSAMSSMLKRVMSPAVSSDPDEEDLESRKRKRDSVSPEVDLILPDIDLASHHTMGNIAFLDSDFTLEDRPAVDEHINIAHNRRAASPPLEHDEREFTQTASDMQQRKQSEQAETQQQPITMPSPSESMPGFELTIDQEGVHGEDESEESAALRNRNAATALFGQSHQLLHIGDDAFGAGSSPMLRPIAHTGLHIITTPKKDHIKSLDYNFDLENSLYDEAELKSAESVDLSELDDLLGGY